MSRTQLVIAAEGLGKTYGRSRALDGLDLAVPAGTVYGLLGPNGAGKTTAVRVLATLAAPDTCWAGVAGHDVVRELDLVRRSIGLAGQHAAVDEGLTGRENLHLVGRFHRLGIWSAVRELTDDGSTVLLTTQYLDEADRLADTVLVLGRGRAVAEGPPERLKEWSVSWCCCRWSGSGCWPAGGSTAGCPTRWSPSACWCSSGSC
ncbi:ATP-binding cassette domain-containing protein [Kitasatospora sp. NPDC052896]|uniref:ATP-binding cassette domain-containing protein n=1 Tax=Kitasatospora sp. NPDC052896 TaxID=3364061 RepID=UPI0037C5DBFF